MPPHPRCWPGQSCLPSATASTPPLPAMHCPPTPGTTHPGPSVRPSVRVVRPGWGQGVGTGHLGWPGLGRAELALDRPQAARYRPWSVAISWTAQPWPPTTAVPTASSPRGSGPATQSPVHQSECPPGCRVRVTIATMTVLLRSEEQVLPGLGWWCSPRWGQGCPGI